MRRRRYDKAAYYRDVRMVPYDLVKELALAMAGTLIVILILSAVLSSPDVPAVTIQSWSRSDPVDFVTTAAAELSGNSVSSGYGPPYNSNNGSTQTWGFFQPEVWAGVHQPVDSAGEFVMTPLQLSSGKNAALNTALSTYQSASGDQRAKWLTAYTNALGNATANANGTVTIASGDYGPVPVLMDDLLNLAQNGALDGLLLASAHFYQTDYTAPLLFMGDGGYLSGLAQDQALTGTQWGMMNETGRYPGQAWLWLYTMWYQVAPFNRDASHGFVGVSSSNADLGVIVVMGVLTLLLVLVPFIPGLRDLPRWIPIHRLIWRRYYDEKRSSRT
ncbi:MAG: hypothetical protein JOZ46_10480 [Candidatus Dormibacteraeota bacterium]|nr:hypothetical protein [Candidatus Dormibacteraeota bacterium]MBV9526225.1 hypothetical protein [Candidatus Dormibacteraeota bacterium]